MNFEGAIGEIDLVQRLVELSREHFTGAIRFEQDGIIKIVYFKGGDVLSASTNDRKDAIDEILLRAGKVSKEHVKQALAKRQESETLGDALLNLGFITRKELTWARRIQVIGILRSIRAWTNGTYAIVADYLPKREEGTLFPLQQIIVEFIVTEQDRQTFDRAMDGGEAVFHKTGTFDESFRSLDLNEDAAEIVQQIDGSRSAAEIAGATGKDDFNVYKLLEALRILGLIDKGVASTAPADDLAGFELAGVADAADAWNAPAEPAMTFEEESPKVPFALKLDANQIEPPPPPPMSEKQWGFDEAQIEAAERAAMPHPPMVPKTRPGLSQSKGKRKGGLVFAIILLLLIGGIATAGWMWWQGRNPAPRPVAARQAKRPAIRPTPIPAPPPAPSSMTTTSAAAATPPAKPATSTVAAPTADSRQPTAISRLEPTTTGGRGITNTSTEPAAVNNNRERYDSMARQYAQSPDGKYTVQFELVCQTSSLAKAMSGGGSSVWFVPTSYRGQACYRVFWGHFETRQAAVAALDRIPGALRGSTPVVVAVPKS